MRPRVMNAGWRATSKTENMSSVSRIFLGVIAMVWKSALVGIFMIFASRSVAARPLYLDPDQPTPKRVQDLLGRMTLEEKVSQMGNNAPALERLGIPKYQWWNEGLHGVLRDGVTVFPQSIGLASSWDPDLLGRVATAISDEARALNNLGKIDLDFWCPVINIARDPRWGRNQETYGEDPTLTGRLAVAYVRGIQGDDPRYLKLIATPKHFALNNFEEHRHDGSSDADRALILDYYLPHFKAAIMEGQAFSIMCAYNSINGVPSCANSWLLQDILRKDWGFEGYVVSDCGAIYDIGWNHRYTKGDDRKSSVLAVRAGCDLECGDLYQKVLAQAVRNGELSMRELDRSLGRLLTARFRLGLFDPAERVPYRSIPASVIDSEEHRELALRAAEESLVLLKNDGLLPLSPKIRSLAVIGPMSDKAHFGDYSGGNPHPVSLLDGLKKALGTGVKIRFVKATGVASQAVVPSRFLRSASEHGETGLKGEYFKGRGFAGEPALTRVDREVSFQWDGRGPAAGLESSDYCVRWTGVVTAPESREYRFSVASDDGARLWIGGKQLVDDWSEHAVRSSGGSIRMEKGKAYPLRLEFFQAAGGSAVSLEWDSIPEGWDKEAVAAAKGSDAVIVALGADGSVEGEELDRKSLDLPGRQQELLEKIVAANPRTALVLVNGSPLTVNWAQAHVPAILEAWYPGEEGGTALARTLFGAANPSGKLPMTFYAGLDQLPDMADYDIRKGRTYMYLKDKPLYPFGHGLSYTTFSYGGLELSAASVKPNGILAVRARLSNTGPRPGKEVAQLYVAGPLGDPKAPLQRLMDFKKVSLAAGSAQTLEFELPMEKLAMRDQRLKPVVKPGKYSVRLGGSSAATLEASFEVLR